MKPMDFEPVIEHGWYRTLCIRKKEDPQRIYREARERRAPRALTKRGSLLIAAADHNGRMITAYDGKATALANRQEYLARLMRLLSCSHVDGVEGTPDILEELLLLNAVMVEEGYGDFLDDKLLIGTMNRGGLLGTAWEMDDRSLAFSMAGVQRLRLDGMKIMCRIATDNPDSGKTLEYCAAGINEAVANNLPVFVEGLFVKKNHGRYEVQTGTEELMGVLGVMNALGTSSVGKWLEVPYNEEFSTVARATTSPILMVQEEKERESLAVIKEYAQGMGAAPAVSGTLIGRNVLFAEEDPMLLAQAIGYTWKDHYTPEQALARARDELA